MIQICHLVQRNSRFSRLTVIKQNHPTAKKHLSTDYNLLLSQAYFTPFYLTTRAKFNSYSSIEKCKEKASNNLNSIQTIVSIAQLIVITIDLLFQSKNNKVSCSTLLSCKESTLI